MSYQERSFEIDAFDVNVSEVLVATPDSCDFLIDSAVPVVLKAMRKSMRMDVAFVSEFVDGQRVYRRADDKAKAQVIRDLVAAALSVPFPVGAFLSAPIVLNDGSVYGTLCSFSFASNDNLTERDLQRLAMASKLIGRRINKFRKHETDRAIQDWKLEPMDVRHH